MPSHYLNQCCNIFNSHLGNKLQWNLKRNSYIFIQEQAFDNGKMIAVSSRPKFTKTKWNIDNVLAIPKSKVHGANMGPTWVLSAPDGPHVGPMNLALRDVMSRILACYQIKTPVIAVRLQILGSPGSPESPASNITRFVEIFITIMYTKQTFSHLCVRNIHKFSIILYLPGTQTEIIKGN